MCYIMEYKQIKIQNLRVFKIGNIRNYICFFITQDKTIIKNYL
jgi:hypothetical protein